MRYGLGMDGKFVTERSNMKKDNNGYYYTPKENTFMIPTPILDTIIIQNNYSILRTIRELRDLYPVSIQDLKEIVSDRLSILPFNYSVEFPQELIKKYYSQYKEENPIESLPDWDNLSIGEKKIMFNYISLCLELSDAIKRGISIWARPERLPNFYGEVINE